MQVVTLSLFRFTPWANRLWVLGQMGAARLSFAAMPGCTFRKLCGSGGGRGFAPRPNSAVWAILACWTDADAAARGLDAPVYRRWARRADEAWTVHLSATAVRGQWAGRTPFVAGDAAQGPLAALTRATIRPRHLAAFWARVPDIQDVIGDDPDVAFKIGIGELPWLHQVTFSIWPDADAMARFARRDGPHARAIAAVRQGDWFAEELYARFRVTGTTGTWGGTDPLQRLTEAA